MIDYWLSKLCFDLQKPGMGQKWRANREEILKDYPLSDELRRAVMADDVPVLAPRVNAYLLRFYLAVSGYDDDQSMAMLHALKPGAAKTQPRVAAHG